MRNLSIKWQLWIATIFVLFSIVVIFAVSQIFFVKPIYVQINKLTIKTNVKQIERYFNNEELETAIDKAKKISYNNWYSMVLFDLNGDFYAPSEGAEPITAGDYMIDSMLDKLKKEQIIVYIELSDENGGEYVVTENLDDNTPEDGTKFSGETDSILFIKKLELKNGDYCYCFLNAYLAPINEASDTIKIVFIITTVLLLIIILSIIYFQANHLSSPIVEINEASKLLAKGNYDVRFSETGYAEIAELGKSLNYAASELKKSEKLQKELIANISHDLRTPLTMIIGYSEMMRDLPTENTPENMNVIIDEAKRLSSLVSDLLDLSRISSGVQSLNKTVFCITDLISDILDRINQFNENSGFKIEFSYSSKVKVEADYKRISQVIYNLVNNAIIHSGKNSTITVRQRLRGNVVRIEVEDNGVGIPKDQLENIWDRYKKYERNEKVVKQGSGLGLSIVKAILTAHNAAYGVISEVNKGSNFWFELHKFTLDEIL